MKKKKIIIVPLIVILLLGIGSVLVRFNRDAIEDKIDELYWKRKYTKTINRYTALVRKHRKDFDYVAETMTQHGQGITTLVRFRNGIEGANEDISNEIANNEELQYHLEKLYELGEIDGIGINDHVSQGNCVEFYCGVYGTFIIVLHYHESDVKVEFGDSSYKINEKWLLTTTPIMR